MLAVFLCAPLVAGARNWQPIDFDYGEEHVEYLDYMTAHYMELSNATDVCYDGLGCFDTLELPCGLTMRLPISPEEMETRFILHSR